MKLTIEESIRADNRWLNRQANEYQQRLDKYVSLCQQGATRQELEHELKISSKSLLKYRRKTGCEWSDFRYSVSQRDVEKLTGLPISELREALKPCDAGVNPNNGHPIYGAPERLNEFVGVLMQREIAELAGVSHTTVRKWNRQPEPNDEVPLYQRLICRFWVAGLFPTQEKT